MKYYLVLISFCISNLNLVAQDQSLYQYLYELEEMPLIRIDTDFKKLQKQRRKKEYQNASITIKDADGLQILSADGAIKVRGHRRKEVCRIPPTKFNLKDNDIAEIGLNVAADKLKFVFVCSPTKIQQEQLLKEYILYDLFKVAEPDGLNARLAEFDIVFNGEEVQQFIGILLEDEDAYALRQDARIVTGGKVVPAALDRTSFVRMLFFQYMIANTDWAIRNKHNIEMVKLPNRKNVVPLAYDFDYSGFVGQEYALPHESLPITSIHERYFFKYKVSEDEYYKTIKFFKAKRAELEAIINNAEYLQSGTRRDLIAYVASFYREIQNEEDFKSVVMN